MQALNLNFDSTYIQTTAQTEVKSLDSKSQFSFMDMVRNEVERREESTESRPVRKTDTEESKSSAEKVEENNDSRNMEVAEKQDSSTQKEDNVKSGEETGKDVSLKEVAKSDSKINEGKEKKVSEDKSLLSKILNSRKNSDEKVKNFETEKQEKNPDSQKNISDLSKKVEQYKLDRIIGSKEDAAGKKENTADKELLASEVINPFEMKHFLDKMTMSSKDESQEKITEVKSHKDVKKLSDVITVTDLRTEKPETNQVHKKNDFVTSIKEQNSNSVQVTMDLTNQAQKNIASLDTQSAASVNSNFQAMLENQITENAADFVKAGNIVLKDNNVGNINLILHPENLGNVKINLELTDKIITGKIIVSSQEAFNAFSSTQDSLRNAFIENGFDNASFDISFANQNQNFANQNQNENAGQNQKYAMMTYDNFVVENSSVNENISDILNEQRDYSINIVA